MRTFAVKQPDGSIVIEIRFDETFPSDPYVTDPQIPEGHEITDIVNGQAVTQAIDTLAQARAAMVCSPVQMRLALVGAGMLTEVNAAAAADPSAAVVWEYATSIYRNSAFIASLAAGFTNPNTGQTITAEEIDALFTAAMAIEP